MVTMTLLERTPDALVYRYFPESDESHGGVVGVNLKTMKREIVQRSDTDTFSWYAFHALREIERMIKSGDIRERTGCAWY